MGLRKAYKTLSEAPGSYVNGVWANGQRTIGFTSASVQPVVMGTDMKAMPEGRYITDYIKIYTSLRMASAGAGQGVQPDLIVFEGYAYEVVSASPHQSGVIPHFKYIACRACKYTSDSDWLSGVMKRA